MKKLLRFSFIIIFLLTCMFPLNIFATEPDDEPDLDKKSFPTSYGAGDFAISIDGVDLNIYKIPAENIVKARQTDFEKISAEEKRELYATAYSTYLYSNPAKVVHLTDDDIVLESVEYTESSNGKVGLFEISFVGLESLSKYDYRAINKEFEEYMDYLKYIEELNGAEPDPSIEEKHMPEYYYEVELVAKISFDKIPSIYQYIYKKDYMRILINGVANPDSPFDVPRINLKQTYNYSIDSISGRDSNGKSYYIRGIPTLSVLDLSKNRLQTPNDKADKTIFISTEGLELAEMQDTDLDEMILSEEGKYFELTELNYRYVDPTQPKDLEVPVENTAATYPLYIYILSAIGILVGALVIVSTRLQSKQKQVQQ